ncbi:hypothetical protein [Neobacillus sp. Marseille-QA0830]
MKKKYSVSFMFLSVASIGAGMALKESLNYSMFIGVGLSIACLLAAGFFLGKNNN